MLSPRGKVVDLGTEFGLSVAESARPRVRVFTGRGRGLSAGQRARAEPGVTIHQDQTAQIDGRTSPLEPLARRERRRSSTSAPSCRRRSSRPARSVSTSRGPSPARSSMQQGRGIGLTHRLPGTGLGSARARSQSPPPPRPPRALELTTTRSDLNTQDRMPTGEYLGCPPGRPGLHRQGRLRDQRHHPQHPRPQGRRPVRALRRLEQRSRTSAAA